MSAQYVEIGIRPDPRGGARILKRSLDEVKRAAAEAERSVSGVGGASAVANDNAARAVKSHAAAIAQLTVAEHRMGRGVYEKRAADIASFGTELDTLRAKYNPLFAASQAYENELNDITRAQQLGAITAQEQAAAIDRLNAQYTATAGAAGVAEAAILGAAHASRFAAANSRQLAFQLIDIGQAIPLAFVSPMYALQNFGFQIAQIGQLYMGQGGLTAAIRDSAVMVGRFITKIGPVGLAVGAVAAAIAGMTYEINRASDVTVGFGDVALATWQVISAGIYDFIQPAIQAIAPWAVTAWDLVVTYTKAGGNLMINAMRAAYSDIQFLFVQLPNVVGAAVIGTANAVIAGIESMVNDAAAAIDFVIEKANQLPGVDFGTIGTVELGEIANPFADKLAKSNEEQVARLREIFASDPLGEFFDDVTIQAVANALRDVEEAAGGAGAALSNAGTDASRYWEDLAREAARAAEEVREFWKGTVSGFINDLRSGLEQGKSFWQSFADAALNALNRIIDRILNGLLDALFQSINFGGSLFGPGFAQQAGPGMPINLSPNAKGGIHSGPGISAFSNSIVSQPTLFAFAKGAGIMGEAGKEAILPLSQTSDGRLGVSAINDNRRQAPPEMKVEIHNHGDAKGEVTQREDGSLRIDVKRMVSDAVAEDVQNNGPVGRTLSGFGVKRINSIRRVRNA